LKKKFKKNSKPLKNGNKVKLNSVRIRDHPDFDSLTWEYKEFINGHENTTFTITNEENHFDVKGLFMLKDESGTIYKWLIHESNLERLKR